MKCLNPEKKFLGPQKEPRGQKGPIIFGHNFKVPTIVQWNQSHCKFALKHYVFFFLVEKPWYRQSCYGKDSWIIISQNICVRSRTTDTQRELLLKIPNFWALAD